MEGGVDQFIVSLVALDKDAPRVVTLTEDAEEVLDQITNHEDTYLDLERVKEDIARSYADHGGDIPSYVRDKYIASIGRIAADVRDEVLDSGFMTRREFSRARVVVAKYVWQEAIADARGRA